MGTGEDAKPLILRYTCNSSLVYFLYLPQTTLLSAGILWPVAVMYHLSPHQLLNMSHL